MPLCTPPTSTTGLTTTLLARHHMKPGPAKSQIYDTSVLLEVLSPSRSLATDLLQKINDPHCYHGIFLHFCSTNKNIMYYDINSKCTKTASHKAVDEFHYGNPPKLGPQVAKHFINLVAYDHIKKHKYGRPISLQEFTHIQETRLTQPLPPPHLKVWTIRTHCRHYHKHRTLVEHLEMKPQSMIPTRL